jgi:hypothetical protein
MIPQAELDRALARWKSRDRGQDNVPTPGPLSSFSDEGGTQVTYDQAAPGEATGETSSGVIPIGDFEVEG